MQVQGVVQRHSDKQWNGKTFWSFALSGQEGWYNTGMKKPPAVGTSVRFNDKTNSKGFKEVDGSIEIITEQATGPTPSVSGVITASTKAVPSYGAGGSAAYWDRKEARDIANDSARELGASRNTAIAIIDLALNHEAIKLPAVAKREEFLWTLLDRYTNKLMGKTEENGDKSATNSNNASESETKGTAGGDEKEEPWN